MSLPNPYAQYRQTQAQTSGQLKLIIMLHDGAIRFLQQASAAIQVKDYSKMSENFNRANDILIHLCASLKPETGEIAVNLNNIYLYCQERTVVANATEDVKIVEEIIGHLRPIRDAWDQIEHSKGSESHASDAPRSARNDWSFAA
ncbi:MAG TPA: flagellar export chaperone FliS [Capsulimonadaceae bacterium]|jgi:flagellar protein FliS